MVQVTENKKIFFPSAWANYDTAIRGSLKIFPNDYFLSSLKADYKDMAEMFFDNVSIPNFDLVMENIKRIERLINAFV